MKLKIAYLYQDELNLYGDTGNVEILYQRARLRGIPVEVFPVNSATALSGKGFFDINIIFMGGGPDAGQKQMYKDLIENKGPYLKDYVENGGVALFICGSYQLMGHYYKSADGSILNGLGVLDLYTEHFGHKKQRCVGNIVAKISDRLLQDPVFKSVNKTGDLIIGFENHGGRTFLSEASTSLAHVLTGHGNNFDDKTEGIIYKNAFGSYLHGPLLSKNPHIADYLIALALKTDTLSPLDDRIITKAHTALVQRFK